jgi:hypothetical protein
MFCSQCVRCVPDSQQRKHNTAGKLCLECLCFSHKKVRRYAELLAEGMWFCGLDARRDRAF